MLPNRQHPTRLLALLAGVLLALTARSTNPYRPDPQTLLGRWRAESFDLHGLKVPLGPILDVRQDALVVSGESFPIERFEVDGKEVTAWLSSGIGLSFIFENPNRVYFSIPLLGYRIYYNRMPMMT